MTDETSAIQPVTAETQAATDILHMMEARAKDCGDELLSAELVILHKALERAAIANNVAYIGGAK